MPGTTFTVDRFGKGTEKLPGSSRFLTHFHSDHYKGLTKGFKAGAEQPHYSGFWYTFWSPHCSSNPERI